jgi:hypothetical protein
MDVRTLLAQIGTGNVLAISGGRVNRTKANAIALPVRYGYSVTIDLEANDTYTVRRVFARGAKRWIKREWTDVHASEVGEIAYRASCYLDEE